MSSQQELSMAARAFGCFTQSPAGLPGVLIKHCDKMKVNNEEYSLFAQRELAKYILRSRRYPLHVILGQKPKTIDFVKCVIELLKNPTEISQIEKFDTSKQLNVIKLDLTNGLENFVEQVKLNPPAADKTNVYIIETYDESILRDQWREYEARLLQLVKPIAQIGVDFKEWRDNVTIIIVAEQPPLLLGYFVRKDVYYEYDLTELSKD